MSDVIFSLQFGNSKSARASLIHVFTRETMRAKTEAPTVTNLAHICFETSPAITRVAYLLLVDFRVPVFVVEAARQWFDVKMNPVKITGAQKEGLPS